MNKYFTLVAILIVSILCHGDHSHDHHHHDHGEQDHVHSGNVGPYKVQDHVYILTDSTLQEALDEFPLILVKFFAPWCGHCKHLAPIYKETAIELAHTGNSQYKIASVDCTVNSEACNKHGIRGYPTLKYFIDGQPHQYSGQRTKQAIIEWLRNKQNEVRNGKTQEQL